MALLRSTAIVGINTLLSRVLGFVRDVLMARALGTVGVAEAFVVALRFDGDDKLMVETRDPDRCYSAVPRIAKELGLPLLSLTSPDNNLGAVFEYLTTGGPR